MAKPNNDQTKRQQSPGKSAKAWLFGSLLPFVCAVLVLPLLALFNLPLLVAEIIHRCRRSCPVHKTPLLTEASIVTTAQADANEDLNRGRRRLTESFWSLDYERWKGKRFPYAGTDRFTRPGTHRRRFCPACREGESSHTFADFENDPEDLGLPRDAVRNLKEAQRRLEDAKRDTGNF